MYVGYVVIRVAMCEVRSRRKQPRTKKEKKYSGQQQKEMKREEPHLAINERTQPIQWTMANLCISSCWFTLAHGALVGIGSLWLGHHRA